MKMGDEYGEDIGLEPKPGRRFAAALLPRLFGTNPRSHHKGATGRVRTGNQRLPVLCHCQLGQDLLIILNLFSHTLSFTGSQNITEQSTVGILSALLLTIQYSFLYAVPSIWPTAQTSYVGSLMSADQLNVYHEAKRKQISFNLLYFF